MHVSVCACECVCMCVHACECVRMWVCVRACMRMCVHVINPNCLMVLLCTQPIHLLNTCYVCMCECCCHTHLGCILGEDCIDILQDHGAQVTLNLSFWLLRCSHHPWTHVNLLFKEGICNERGNVCTYVCWAVSQLPHSMYVHTYVLTRPHMFSDWQCTTWPYRAALK